jgi:hypothetical protein
MQLPNLGALSLYHAVSAPGPSVVEIDEPDDENVRGVEVEPDDSGGGNYFEVDADDVVTHEYEEEEEEEDEDAAIAALMAVSQRPKSKLQKVLDELDKQATTPKSAGKQPAAAKGGPSADAMRARQARQAAEEEEGAPSKRSRGKQQKSEAELEAARLARNRKQRERNAAKSVEGVVEKLIKQVEAQNAPTKKPEVIDLTGDEDDAPEEEKKKKKKKMTWWMIREEDARTPGERHASNEGTYDRLELRKGSKGLRFNPPK